MTTPRKKCIATEAALFLAALCTSAAAFAAPAGVVTQASGPLFAQGEQGRIKAISADSAVSPGEMLVTGRETFAQVRFNDGGVMTLGPDTRVAIVAYAFDAAIPMGDRSELRFETGAVRIEPGALARRNPDRQSLVTPSGTIRGGNGSYIATYIAPEASVALLEPIRLAALSGVTMSDAPLVVALTAPVPGAKAPGLYVHVIDGLINLTNQGGSLSFAPGQFGYTPSFKQPPIVLPQNPGMQFTPPPTFSSTSGSKTNAGNKSNAVDCEVR